MLSDVKIFMELKTIRFENLYNVDFSVVCGISRSRKWQVSTFGTNKFWDVPRHNSAVMYFYNCDAILKIRNGETLKFESGSLIYVPQHLRYGIKLVNCGEDYMVHLIDFKMLDCEGNFIISSEIPVKIYPQLINSFLSHHAKIDEFENLNTRFTFKCNLVASDFLSDVIQMYRKDVHNEMRYMNISKAIDYLEQHYTEHISNKELAKLCSISQDCFIRTFKMYYDTTPRQYILDLRIKKAKEMLVSHSKNVNEIAYSLGFESATYFSNMFKKKVGVSPNQYKNQTL